MNRKLLSPGRALRFDYHSLMRGNLRDTAQSLKDLAQTGAVTVNDAREMLGLPQDTERGNEPIAPAIQSTEGGES
jgi:hypothetical protein